MDIKSKVGKPSDNSEERKAFNMKIMLFAQAEERTRILAELKKLLSKEVTNSFSDKKETVWFDNLRGEDLWSDLKRLLTEEAK